MLSSRSNLLVSSAIVRINVLPRVVRWVRLSGGFNVLAAREVVVNSRKVFVTISLPNCQAIDFLRRVRQRHGCAGLISAHRGQVQILLQPAQRKVRGSVISVFDSLPFQGEERSGCWPA